MDEGNDGHEIDNFHDLLSYSACAALNNNDPNTTDLDLSIFMYDDDILLVT